MNKITRKSFLKVLAATMVYAPTPPNPATNT